MRRESWTRRTHLEHVATVELPPDAAVCTACLEAGSSWVHLRMCLTCANVACCNSPPLRHVWCYLDGFYSR